MTPPLLAAPTIITCHINADWDALSSMLGMAMLVPDAVLIFPGSMEKTLHRFYTERLASRYRFHTTKEIDPDSIRRLIIVDTQNRTRIPHVDAWLDLPQVSVEVWDHHPTPLSASASSDEQECSPAAVSAEPLAAQHRALAAQSMAPLASTPLADSIPKNDSRNGVQHNTRTVGFPPNAAPEAPLSAAPTVPSPDLDGADAAHSIPATTLHVLPVGATCTLICQELQRRAQSLTPEQATFLGLGIYGDTGSFTYSSATPADFQAAAWLREQGMSLPCIADLVHTNMTSLHIKVLNALLEAATLHEVGKYTVIITDIALDSFLSDFAYLAQKFMDMESCDVLFALASMEGKVQVVARSRIDAVNVGVICTTLGGGGHRLAASASVKTMPVPELKDAIFQQLYAQIHPNKRARDLMSSPPVGIEEQQSILEAEQIMNRYGLKAAPVFRTGTRHCVGYMECQIASRAIAHDLGAMSVAEYMQRTVLTVSPDAPLQKLMRIIVGAHQRLVPVVEHNEVIGVVTRTDMINMFVEDPTGMAIPKNASARERNLAKLLQSRLPRPMLDVLRLAGELGDANQINVYAVGGFVRDLLLNRPATELDDVDLVVEGNGITFAKQLAQRLGGRVREHRTFMTALIIYPDHEGKEQRLDVATARLEYYKYPAALPTVELSSIKMDLFRRDFTINAMAVRLNTPQFGSLVDFFGGQGDVQRKTIRVIHALSFVEDPTRILRAVRFEQRYGFRISLQSEKLIKNALSLNLVEKLSGARILHELHLIFREAHPLTCLERLHTLGVLSAIHPDLALTPDKRALLEALGEVIDWYRLLYLEETPDNATLYLLALCSAVPAHETDNIFQRLGIMPAARQTLLSIRDTIRNTTPALLTWYQHHQRTTSVPKSTSSSGASEASHHIHSQHEDSATSGRHEHTQSQGDISTLCALLHPLSLEALLYLMARTADEPVGSNISQYIYKWRHVRADITGEDLRALGLPPGPAYGTLIRMALAAKLDDRAPTRDAQLALVRKAAGKILQKQ